MTGNDLKILAIDDKQDNLTVLKAVVGDAFPGAAVFTAPGGAKGIELALTEDPDVILLDIVMPEMDGFEVCRRLKADERLKYIPVVFLTAAKTSRESRIKALEAGGEAFLPKPLEEAELLAQIRAMAKIKAASAAQLNEKARLEKLVEERTRALQQELAAHDLADAALRESEARNRALVKAIPDLIFLNQRDGRFLSVHAQEPELLYARPETFLHRKVDEVLPPPVADMVMKSFAEALDSHAVQEVCYSLPAGGQEKHFEARMSPCENGTVLTLVRDITRRKWMEEELRRAKQRIEMVVTSSTVILYACEAFGDFDATFVSDNILTITGHTNEEFLSKGFWVSHIHPEDAPRVFREIATLFKYDHHEYEYRFMFKDGSYHWMSDGLKLIRDDKGDPLEIIGTWSDITERKLAQEELRRSEARLAEAQTIAKTGSWETMLSDLSVQWSAEIFRIFELDPAVFRPTHPGFLSFVHPEDRAKVDAAFVASIEGGSQNNSIEHRIMTAAGREKHVEERWHIVRDDKGRPVRAVGVCQDITEHKLTAEALRASEAELRTMAEAMPQIVWVTRPDGWNIYFNQKWTDYTGLTLEESIGQGWNKPFHPDDWQLAWDAWQRATAEIGAYSIECRLRRADGVYRWWLVRGVPHLDAAGNILKWYVACTDIHDLKMAEKEREEMRSQLQQSQKLESIGQLAGGVAHDFNNILTAIKCSAEFIRRDLAPQDPKTADLLEILTASDRAAALTGQLLAFSRRQVLAPKAMDLNKCVKDTSSMLKRLIGEDITLKLNLSAAPCPAMLDAGQIGQVLVNLAVNARDAMPGGGAIKIATEVLPPSEAQFLAHPDLRRGPLVCLIVADTGCGMTEEVKRRLFEPFFTTKEQGKGTGLGLATVFGIVKQSGGDIAVESEPGKGVLFRICFPSCELAPEPAVAGGPQAAGGAKNGETILLVEDEDSLLRLGRRVLLAGGYKVLTAASGLEALKEIERHGKAVDLLVTDLLMPGMSGRELGREFARRNMAGRTLYMSGYTNDAMLKHGLIEPGIAFIHKPFTVEAFSVKLREVLDGPADQAKA